MIFPPCHRDPPAVSLLLHWATTELWLPLQWLGLTCALCAQWCCVPALQASPWGWSPVSSASRRRFELSPVVMQICTQLFLLYLCLFGSEKHQN